MRAPFKRSISANAIVYDNTLYVIDTGYGAAARLLGAGLPLPAVRYIFITHHHSDHNIDLGPLLSSAWTTGLRTPVDVYGPKPLDAMIKALWEAYRFDLDTRIADEGRPDLRKLVAVHEYGEGPVLSAGNVEVTALRNLHPPIQESFAFKFKFGTKSIVISGDTAYFPPLAEFAKGADILVHEAMYGPGIEALVNRLPNAATLMDHLKAAHTLTGDVGRIAAAAGVRKLVLSHLVPGDDPSITDEMWSQDVAKWFKGEIVVAQDLMEIRL